MSSPLVSIVIPVYNVEQWLKRCVDSVINQSYTNLEIILVDDGSTDNCGKICDDYAHADNRIKVIHKSNGGLSDARNAGTEIATGEYIYFLDSDDWIVENAIESLVTFAKNQNCDIVQGGFYYDYTDHLLYDNRWIKEDTTPFILSREEAMTELIKNQYVKNFAWGKLYKTNFVKRLKFPVGKYFEDSYWQHLIVDQCEKYGIIPQPLYYYLQRGDSISGQFTIKGIDLLKGLEIRLEFIRRKYPNLLSDMLISYLNVTFQYYSASKKACDKSIAQIYSEHWKYFIHKYNNLMNRNIRKEYILKTQIVKYNLTSIYTLIKRVKSKLKL